MLVVLFSLTTFVSAFLLFWVQPLIAKLLLPLLGGTPAVWNTAMMFFQVTLLAGYLYVHLLGRLGLAWQFAVHGVVLGAALAFLPFGTTAGLVPPADGSQILWLLGTLATLVGLPFFAISASAPLLQAWFGRSTHPQSADPYFLYAASNLGSFASLLGFPFVLERSLHLPAQGAAWAGLFHALLLLMGLCFLALLRNGARLAAPPPAAPAAAIAWRERWRWIALAFVPSSLLLGVTSYVATDLASVPLLWVIPLALYLLTFIIAFGRGIPAGWALAAQIGGVTLIAVLLGGVRLLGIALPVWASVPAHVGGFFAIALDCHCALAARRPAASRLTEFYLCMSIGGAAGGVLNALVAPLVFNSTYEYEIGLAAAAALILVMRRRDRGGLVLDVVMASLPIVVLIGAAIALKSPHLAVLGRVGSFAVTAVIALALLGFARRPARFALGICFILGGGVFVRNVVNVVHEERSFFGVHRIRQLDQGKYLALFNGDIIHGVQSTDPQRWREPLTYYAAAGPSGQFFTALPPVREVAIIGLGTGGLACYARPGETWRFYEIDATVARIARDPRHFHYLHACGDPEIVLGDGRLTLAAVKPAAFDVIVLDAFSSDSIPVHLLTIEAIELYVARLAPGGRLLIHISNKYVGLAPVVAAAATRAGMRGLHQFHQPTPDEASHWITRSEWIALARTDADLAFLATDPRWQALPPAPGFGVWSDDFSNVAGVIKW